MNKETIFDGVPFSPCPFCGSAPSIQTLGTSIDVECCARMSFQKSDSLTLEERGTFNSDTLKFSFVAEDKCLKEAAKLWNKRPGKTAQAQSENIELLQRMLDACDEVLMPRGNMQDFADHFIKHSRAKNYYEVICSPTKIKQIIEKYIQLIQ